MSLKSDRLEIGLSIYFFPKKGIQNTNILCLSNSKAPSKVKPHLLTSCKVNVTKGAPREDEPGSGPLLVANPQTRVLSLLSKLVDPDQI